MTISAPSVTSAHGAADAAVRDVLQTQWNGVPSLRLDSPPGAGKTGVVERLAVQSMGLLGERCMVVTQTNEQAFDVARRLAQRWPTRTFHLLTRDGLMRPADVAWLPNVVGVHDARRLPAEPCVAIANGAKWSWVPQGTERFDLQIVDEAFQLPDYRFQQIANLAERVVLVGDPGQIAPIVNCEIERWRADPAGPHVACPHALLARHPSVPRLALPVSRRLPPDTVQFVQPAFYPSLPFTALAAPTDRALRVSPGSGSPLDAAIDMAVAGASLLQLELPALVSGEVDAEVADTLVALIKRLLARGSQVLDDGRVYDLGAEHVGVVCAHVAQVNAVRERLPGALVGVLVETADRFQGLERPVMLVWHPLSGRADASEFHLDAGRLCVMLSRHRVACFIVARTGIAPLLHDQPPSGNRILGSKDDPEFGGWRAHVSILEALERCRRTFPATLSCPSILRD